MHCGLLLCPDKSGVSLAKEGPLFSPLPSRQVGSRRYSLCDTVPPSTTFTLGKFEMVTLHCKTRDQVYLAMPMQKWCWGRPLAAISSSTTFTDKPIPELKRCLSIQVSNSHTGLLVKVVLEVFGLSSPHHTAQGDHPAYERTN